MSTRRLFFFLLVAVAFLIATGIPTKSQDPNQNENQEKVLISGRNVNMVSGITLPHGDPYLQRQNEPSIAVSTRNPLHLIAGANDYRTVDMFIDNEEFPGYEKTAGAKGDAWLGVFKSYDGGQSWTSTLLPGFPQDSSNSPLKGFSTAADPVVRVGTNGLFYYSGIVFNRDKLPGQINSAVFLARFIDNNNEEGGDTIEYIDTQIIADDEMESKKFADKPWIAVDAPHGKGRKTNVGGQEIARHSVYIVYSVFSEDNGNLTSEIIFRKSEDCGNTWEDPIVLSTGHDLNQGATIAVDPRGNGHVYVAWRRFSLGGESAYALKKKKKKPQPQSNAIIVARSVNSGKKFNKIIEVAEIPPFDQPSTEISFRTNSYPTMAVDDSGRIYLAWAQRYVQPTGAARIVLTTSMNGKDWTIPEPIDNPIDVASHQFMPTLTFAAGKLTLAWYDQRLDFSGWEYSWPDMIQDSMPIRHTVDVWAAQADTSDYPYLNWTSTQVSRYLFALMLDEDGNIIKDDDNNPVMLQMQFNPPNYPLFKGGTWPFIGDYVDVSPSPMFVVGEDGIWRFNTEPTDFPVFHVTWTDNRDVRPPIDPPYDWTNYSPPTSDQLDEYESEDRPPCPGGQGPGMRNQNIYTSRLSWGIEAGALVNSKPLDLDVPRSFVIFVRNNTGLIKIFRLTTANQPPGGQASFLQFEFLESLDVKTAPYSTMTRPIFIDSSDENASVRIAIEEIDEEGNVIEDGLTSYVIINPDPDNPGITGGGVESEETHNPNIVNPNIVNWYVNPNIVNPNIVNPNIVNPNIVNPNIVNPNIVNPNIVNPNIVNPNIVNPNIVNPNIVNPNIVNPNIVNPNIVNPNIVNPNIVNPNIVNANPADPEAIRVKSVTDVGWTVINEGNTTTSYTLKALAKESLPDGFYAQLLVYKVTYVPAAAGSLYNAVEMVECELKETPQHQLLLNIVNPNIVNPNIVNPNIVNPNIVNASIENATFSVAPGEEVLVTLRIFEVEPLTASASVQSKIFAQQFILDDFIDSLGFGVVSHSVDSEDAEQDIKEPKAAASILLISTASLLPDGFLDELYSATLKALGGTESYDWWVDPDDLPPGLHLYSDGMISGTPTSTGTYSFTVQVTDSSFPDKQSDNQLFWITIKEDPTAPPPPLTITTESPLPPGNVRKQYGITLMATGGVLPYRWSPVSGTLPDGLSLDELGVISGTPTAERTFNFTVQVTDSSVPTAQTDTKEFYITINPSDQVLTISGMVTIGVSGNPLKGVRIHGLRGAPTTDASGFYSDTVPDGWSGTATPFKAGYSFAPPELSYTNVILDQPNQNYTASHLELDHFEFSTIYTPQTAGSPFSITITAVDSGGNPVTIYTGPNALSDTTGTISPTTTGAFINGTWTGDVIITTAATDVTITTSGGGKSGESDPFDVNVGALDHFIVDAPDTGTAGTAFSVTITAKDAGGNTTTIVSGATTLSVYTGTIDPTTIAEGQFTDDGVWTGDVTLSEPGERTITAANNGKIGSDTITIILIPTIQFTTGSSGGDESVTPANLELSLSAVSSLDVSVNYAVSGGTATGGGVDYTLAAGTATILAGYTTTNISIAIEDDSLYEPDETIEVTISDPTNATLGANTIHTYTIEDNDPFITPTIQFTTGSSSGNESVTPAYLELSLSAVSSLDVSVNYAVSGGTATGGGVDYTLAASTANILAGYTTTNISIAIVDDSLYEPDETIEVTISNPVNATLGANTIHTYTIEDNDPFITPTIQFTLTSSSGDESQTPANLELSLSAPSGLDVTVDYAVSGGNATGGGVDYTLAAGIATIPAETLTTNISIEIVNDLLDELDETIEVTISTPTNATLGTNTSHTYTILDNDALPSIEFTLTSSSAAESVTPANLELSLSAASGLDVTVDYAVGGNATGGGVDYTLAAGSATITAGNTTADISITIAEDTLYEDDETIIVSISNPVNATLGTNTVHTYTILDNDSIPSVSFTDAPYTISEDGISQTVTVGITGESSLPVSVDYATSDLTATAGEDYTATSGILTWAPGDTTAKTFDVALIDNSIYEVDETINLTLSGAVNCAIGDPNPTTITITDNDSIPSVSFTDAPYTISEDGTSQTVTVGITGESSLPVSVNYATSDGTATAVEDYTATSDTLTWIPGDTTAKTFDVALIDNSIYEVDETINLTLSGAVNCAIGDPNPTTITITDNDSPPPLQIITTWLPDAVKGSSYSEFLQATGVPPLIWSLAAGSSLPNGLDLNPSTGEIGGTPTVSGNFNFTVEVTDAIAQFDTQDLSLTVAGWAATYNGPGNGEDTAHAIAVDSSGNIYVTGLSMGSGTLYDYSTIKYDSSGSEVWTSRYDGPAHSNDSAHAIAVDSWGNVYVTGRQSFESANQDYATIKYDSSGQELWVARYDGGYGWDEAQAIAVDSSGNVYVTGWSEGSGTGRDYATVKYDSSGQELWVARYNGPVNGNDSASALAVDSSGNVYVTGSSFDLGTIDYATIKYDSSGLELWVARYNGPGNLSDEAHALAVDSLGNIYVTGYSYGSGTGKDYATVKYDSSGTEQWVARYDGGHGADGAHALAVDPSGNVYVTGESYGSGSNRDFATIKYNSSKVQQWITRYNGTGDDYDVARAISVDSLGNVYVTGPSIGSGTGQDYATIKYDSSGNEDWVRRYNGLGSGDDISRAIALDSLGNVHVTGGSIAVSSVYKDYATVRYSQSFPLTLIISTETLDNGYAEVPYAAAVWAFGCSGLRTWSLATGDLPPGLNLDASTGVISGTPTTADTYNFTVQVKDGILFDTQDLSITINPGYLDHFDVDAPATGTASIAFSITVAAKDAGGNTTPNVSGDTVLSVDTGTITPDIIYEAEFTDDGVWTADVTLSEPGSRIITATNNTKTGSDTLTISLLPTIKFTTSSSSGNESSSPASLELTLSAASSFDVTVNYAVTGGTATGDDYTLLGTGTATINTGDTAANISIAIEEDSLSEPNETIIVTISSPVNATLGTNTQHTYTIEDNDPAKLVFDQQPTSTVAGAIITPAVTVKILDVNDNLVTTATDTVTIAINDNPGGGTLSGTSFLLKQAVGGVATFNDLSIDRVGTGYTLKATSGVLAQSISDAFDITAAAANYFKVTGESSLNAGTSNELAITAYDQFENVATGYTGLQSLTFSGPGTAPDGTVPTVEGTEINTSVSVNFTAGVSDTGAATLVAYNAESISVDVTDGAINSFVSDDYDLDLTVTPALMSAADASISEVYPDPATAGSPVSITVTTYDEFQNALTLGGDAVAIDVAGSNTATPAVTDNTDGTYTASYTPTTSGTDNITGTINAAAIGRDLEGPSDGIYHLTVNLPTEIVIISPAGGETWYTGGTYEIRWIAPAATNQVQIQYSWDDGATLTIANFPDSVPASDGLFLWTVPTNNPALISNQARIRIVDYGNPSIATLSEQFTMKEAITIISPAGGETWYTGETYEIRWSAPISNQVQIQYSWDDGATLTIANFPDSVPASDGLFLWTVPTNNPALISNQARIRIVDYENSSRSALSEQFTMGGPDLIVESLTHYPTNPTTADTITFTAVVKNNGPGSAAASTLMFAIGGQTQGLPGTLFAIGALASGASQTVTRTATLTAQGYTNTATADYNGDVAESNEGNNTATDSYTVTAPPDLIVESMTHSPANPTTADTITFTAVVKNNGPGSAGASTLMFKIGGETTGIPATLFAIGALAPGASQTVTRTATLTAQGYTNTATADYNGDVAESNEGNNTATDSYTVTAALPDLIVSSGNPTVTPSSVVAGGTVQLSAWTVRNQGTASSGFFGNGFYLSTDATITSSDTYLDGNSNNSLSAGESFIWGVPTLTIPAGTTPGSYYIGILVDHNDIVQESNESNNFVRAKLIVTAVLTEPDLIVSSGNPTVTPSSVVAGGTVQLSAWTVMNQGFASSGFFGNGFYLSTDATITSSDTYLDGNSNNSLSAGESFIWGVPTLTIPAGTTPGSYYIGILVDHNDIVQESNESNNFVSISLTVTVAPTVVVVLWELNGTFNSANPVPPTSMAPNVTAGNLIKAAALTAAESWANAFVASGWPTTGPSVDLNKYFEFSVGTGAGYEIVYDSVEFSFYNNMYGSGAWQIRSSVDNYASVLDSGFETDITFDGAPVHADISSLGVRSGNVTFRVYSYNNSGETYPDQRGFRGSASPVFGLDLKVIGVVQQ